MKLIIHIGPHKTGTTSLQYFLYENREFMKEYGVCYPEACFYHFAQHRIAFSLKGMRDPKKGDYPNLNDELSQLRSYIVNSLCNTILISSEEFFSLEKEKIELFRDLLNYYFDMPDIYVILFMRRPDNLFISIYNQMAKDPGNNFFSSIWDFVNSPASLHPDLRICRNVYNWVNCFGKDSITIKLIEVCDIIGYYNNILKHHGVFLNCDPGNYRVNASDTYPVIELMRYAKRTGMDLHARKKLYKIAVKMFNDGEKLEIGGEARRSILKIYETCLSKLFLEFNIDNIYEINNIDFRNININKTIDIEGITSEIIRYLISKKKL